MNKTIVESAWNFARKQWGKQVPHTIDKIADMLIDFGNEIQTMPLAQRLTAEEKEQIRFAHKAAKTFAERTNPMSAEVFKGQYLLLESIFGSDMFNKKEK